MRRRSKDDRQPLSRRERASVRVGAGGPLIPGLSPKGRGGHPEAGQIALEYVVLLAAVILPLVAVVYMLWEILMYFYWNNALVLSIPYL